MIVRTVNAHARTLHRMTVSARDVAAVLRSRLPGLPVEKLHPLLYYCQGHHLAVLGEPLFAESISAADTGPIVTAVRSSDGRVVRGLDEGQLNTVGYVLSRYGGLTGTDLGHLTRGERPWQLGYGRRTEGSARIEPSWIRDYFATDGTSDGPSPDSPPIRSWLADATPPLPGDAQHDDLDEIRRRLAAGA